VFGLTAQADRFRRRRFGMLRGARLAAAARGRVGLYMMLFVGVPFTVIGVRGRAFLQAVVAQLYVAVGALIVSAIMASEWPLVLWVLVVTLETMIIAGLPSLRRVNLSARSTKLLIVPLVLGAIPWMVHAVAM
jgi:hypothetical protein